jgi:hypothetical protein
MSASKTDTRSANTIRLWPLLALNFFMADWHRSTPRQKPKNGPYTQPGRSPKSPVPPSDIIPESVGGLLRNQQPVLLASFLALSVRGLLAFFFAGWWGVFPIQVLDGVGASLQSVAVPGMVARALNGTGQVNLGQGAVTVQGIGASLSPAHGGWVAQWIGYEPAFLLLGAFGVISVSLWTAFACIVKQY